MLELKAERFIRAIKWLTSVERNQAIYEGKPEFDGPLQNVSHRVGVLNSAKEVEADIISLRAAVSALAMADLIASLEDKDCTVQQITAHAQDVGRTLKRELSSVIFYVVPSDRRKYIEASSLFGDRVSLRFPMAEHDIDEAGKCLALQRPTACVMHLMRVLEVGLQSLAQELGVPEQTNWNTLLNQIERLLPEITAKRFSPADEQWFSEVASHFRLLKNGFRNHAMHFREKYSDQEAENIYNHTKAFMQQIAVRLSDPLGRILN